MQMIPYQNLETDILLAILEEYASRDGTDYGAHEVSLEDKVAQLHGMLKSQEVFLFFEPISGTCDLVSSEDAKRLQEEYNACSM